MKKALILLIVLISTGQLFSQTINGGTGSVAKYGETCFNATVSGIGTINGTYGLSQVCLNLTHNYVGDVKISLIAPDGTIINLSTYNGGSNNNYATACFTATATTSITTALPGTTPAYNGTFLPEASLGLANNGQNANGTWKLCITDIYNGAFDVLGSLNSWSLTFSNSPAPIPTPPSCLGNAAAGNTCATATPICELNGYCGNTSSSYTSDTWTSNAGGGTGLTDLFCGSIENNSFLYFVASASTVSFDVWVYGSTTGSGIQMLIFRPSTCGSGAITKFSCYNEISPGGPTTVTASGLTAGQTYYLMIDGYAGDVANYTIQAEAGINIPVTAAGATTICGGQNATLTASGGNGTFSWQTGATSLGSGSSITVSPTSTTTYTVSSTTGNPLCPNSTLDYVTVTVNNPATITASDPSICSGQSTTISSSVSSGGGIYSWSNSLGSGATSVSVSPTTTTNYTVFYTKSGCVASDIATVTVNPTPVISGGPGNITICHNSLISATNFTLTPPTGTILNWTNNNTSIGLVASGTGNLPAFTATNTGTSAVTSTITVTPVNGSCTGTPITYTITVNPNPNANFTVPINQCLVGNSFNFSSAVTTGNSWTFGASAIPNTSTLQNPSGVVFNTSGTYPITHQVIASGCTTSVTNNITVNPNPLAISGTNQVFCSGASANLGGPSTSGFGYAWTPTTGLSSSTVSNPAITLTNAGAAPITTLYTITMTNTTTLCTDTDIVSVTVNPLPTISGTLSACVNGTTTLTGSATPHGISPWTSSNTSVATISNTGVVTGITAGTTTITYMNSNGCTKTATVTINALPTITGTLTACINGTTSLTGSITAHPTTPWTSSNTGVATVNGSGVITGVTAGTSEITYMNNNGCTQTASVTINPLPSISGTLTVCAGLTTTLSGSGTSNATNPWTSSNISVATVSNTGVVTGVAAGFATITYTNSNGCSQTATVTVTALPSITGTFSACVNGSTTLSGSATPNVTNPWTSSNTGVATITNGGVVTGISAGSSTITYTNSNGCIITSSVTINALPTITGTLTACAGSTISLTGSPNANATNPWISSNTGVANVSNTGVIFGVSAGSSVITYTNSNGCTQTAIVTINALPTITGTLQLCAGTTTTLTGSPTANTTTPWTSSNTGAATINSGGIVSGIAPGTSTITYMNSNGCTQTASLTINTLPTATSETTNSTCGSSNGTATVTAAGGSPGYTYSWSNNATTATANNLAAGSYSVTITDTKGCSIIKNLNVTDAAAPTAIITSSTNISCNAGSDGTASISVTGGSPPYNVSWSGASTGNPPGTEIPSSVNSYTITGLISGSYTISITDNNGCIATTTVTLTQTALLSSNISSSTNINCNGGNNGAASVSVTGGTTPYTYSWSPSGGTTASATNLTAGNYTVTITDSKGCTSTNSVTLTEPTILNASINGTNVSCNGGTNGSADVTVTGGTSPYNYVWNNASTTEDLSSLVAGTYNVTVTDSKSCSAIASVNITQPASMSLVTDTTSSTCGNSNGEASVVASGGAGGYTYSWSPIGGNTTSTGNILPAGSYTVTVTDLNSCIKTAAVNVTDIASPTSNITTSNNVSCSGGNNGSATVTASGGGGVYTYSWSPNGGNSATASNLTAGTYVVTVKDQLNCITNSNVTITEPTPLIAAESANTSVTCNAGNNGSASVIVSGGTAPYSYSWSPTGGTSSSASGLIAGSYTVFVNDNKGCTTNMSITITEPNPLITNTIPVNVLCNNGTTGSIDLNISGGTAPYTYSWSNGSSTEDISSLTAGTYNVSVTDAKNCTTTVSTTITEPTIISLNTSNTPASCGTSDGSLTVTAGGGTGPFTYSWSPGGATSATVNGLVAGTYTVIVKDANNCQVSATSTIVNTAAPTVNITSSTNVKCNGGNDGSATALGSGGTGVLNYSWTPGGGTNATANNLSAGNYNVTVTDNLGCSASASITITQPAAFSLLVAAQTDPKCNGGSDGAAVVSASGGISPYNYSWSNSAIGNSQTGLSAGNYTVTVNDFNNCSTNISFTLNEPTPLIASNVSTTNVSCFGGSDGNATIIVNGGTPGYTYSWSPSGGSGTFASGLSSGNYTVIITDNQSCNTTLNLTIAQPNALSINNVTQDALCNGGATGAIDLTVSGGTIAYSYSWSNGATSEDLTNIPSGSYSVSVTDSKSCSSSTIIQVNEAGQLNIQNTNINHANCGKANGSATVLANGGTSPYIYSWSNSTTDTLASNLSAGTYTAIVSDANGCYASINITINDIPAGVASVTSVNPSCLGVCNGSATVNISGGTAPYTYSWNNNSNNSNALNLCDGTYNVTVTDALGCVSSASATLTNGPSVTSSISSKNVLCNGGSTGNATVTATGGSPNFTYNWSNGQNSATATNLSAGSYTVILKDEFGCMDTNQVNISEPSALAASSTHNNVLCYGGNTGSININTNGATPPYSFTWNPAVSNISQASGLTAGTYSINISDTNGCTINLSATITEPQVLSGALSPVNANCSSPDGIITSSINGGTLPYTYSWNNGANSANLNNITTGSYSLIVSDSNSCTLNLSAFIGTNGGGDALISTITNVTCNGLNNGSASATIIGGFSPFTYLWNDSSNQTNSTAQNLAPGSYIVTVTDSKGCIDTAMVSITEPPILTGSTSSTQTNCNNSCDGQIAANITGGTSPYFYNWDDIQNQTTPVAINLCDGSYSVNVKDANNCSITLLSNVISPLPISISTNNTLAGCSIANGTANANAQGSNGGFTYTWSNSMTGSSINNLASGAYYVTAIDQRGCRDSVAVNILSANGPVLVIDSLKDLKCFNSGDGQIFTSVISGLAPFNYSWSNGNLASPNISGLNAGLYSLTVIDSNGCAGSISATLNQPDSIKVSAQGISPKCNGGCDGAAFSNVIGGTLPYTFQWDNSSFSTSDSVLNLCAGTYSVIITDANNCNAKSQVIIDNPPFIIAVATSTQTLCASSCDGTATVSITNGQSPYSYQWSDNSSQTTQTAIGLCLGDYSVNITDANGCSTSTSVSVTNPNPFTLDTGFIKKPSCYGFCDGSLEVIPVGGNGPFTVNWSDPSNQTGFNASNLCVGTYLASATDNNGCTANLSLTLTQPSLLTANIVKSNPSCFNKCDGTAIVNINGGTSPYQFNWIPTFDTIQSINNLCNGTYSVTVSDNNNCIVIASTTLTQPAQILLNTGNIINSNCLQNNGSACVNLSGGIAPVSYSWNNGQTGSCINNVNAGVYTVNVKDANGCNVNHVITIDNINGPSVSIPVHTDVTCFGLNDGTASAAIIGGTAPYTVLWNDSNATAASTIGNLSPGVYAISITDNAGCIGTASVEIKEDPELLGGFNNINPVSCSNRCDGNANVIATGGVAPYTFTWQTSPAQFNPNGSNLCVGNNSVLITDSKGCKKTVIVNIPPSNQIQINQNISNVTCNSTATGSAFISVSGGNSPYIYNWSPSVANSQSATNLTAGIYTIEIMDASSCAAYDTIIISQPDSISIISNSTPVTCNLMNGSATINVTGGTPAYSYLWNPSGQVTSTASGLASGNYLVVIKDANNCTSNKFVNVGLIEKPMVTLSTTNILCYGFNNGTATANTLGGVPPFNYSWSPSNQNTAVANNLFAGTHNLTITDATGCTAYGTGIINQPQPLTLTTSPNINICNAQNAQIYATATGGVPIYSYTWNPTNDSTSGITVSPSNTTTYSVSAIDQNGCIIGPKSILITVRPPLSTNILGPDTICIGSTATFNTSVNGGLGTYIYSWIPVSQSASNLTVLPSNPGQYIYSVIVKDGCSLADTAQVSLVVNSKPSIVFVSNINEGCIPLTVNYTSSASSAGNINWDFGDSNSGNGNSITHTYNQSGSFNVSAIIVSPEGCSDTIVKTDYITVFPLPQADFNFSPKDELDVFNSEVSFTDNSTIPFTWLWNFGDSLSNFSNYTSIVQNPVHVFKDTGEYCITLLVTSDKGCKDTTVKCLYIKPSVAIYIPNAFTPNEDGINEGFKPIHVGIVDEDYSFMIFDRWGNLIYQTKNRFDSWDGTLNDEPCQIDTYIYRLQCKDIHTNPHNYTGQVHLVR